MKSRPRRIEDDIAPKMGAAVAAHRAGRLAEAIAGYRQVVSAAPRAAEAHNNLGTALKAAGCLDAAVDSLRRAVKIRPEYVMAQGNLASALAAAGRADEALQHWLVAFRLEPDNPIFAQGLARTVRPMRFARPSPHLRRALEALLRSGVVEPQPVAPAAISLLRLDGDVRRLTRLAEAGDDAGLDQALSGAAGARLFSDPLLEALLLSCLVADEALERLLAAIRRRYLLAATSGDERAAPGPSETGFMAALACQCFSTEYVWELTSAERGALDALLAAPDRLRGEPAILVAAMYAPLRRLFDAPPPLAGAPGAALVLRRQWHEPECEHALARSIQALTAIEDAASRAVRAQYEEDPYPRWLTTRQASPQPLRRIFGSLFPGSPCPLPDREAPRVLVAGCGTGKHAVEVATRYAGADVLAVDLSLASLAYARRKAEEMELGNLRFAQADILGLGQIEERFDLIESLGVLHHMADPEAGWRVLTGLLAPGGLMRIGLYSARARERIHRARDHVRGLGLSPSPEGIREARAALRALPPDDPAHEVTRELDFFSASGCRDFLFHVQEAAYELPEIAAMLERLGLDFVGFETFSDAPKRLYARRFPEDPAMANLANWDRLEREEPRLFHNMYQFWCRARAEP